MLSRQKTILGLLAQAPRPLSATVFVKLVFLLRHETELEKDPVFYDFVPYKYGPFSFALYSELGSLRQSGYVTPEEEQIALCKGALDQVKETTEELPKAVRQSIAWVMNQYGGLSQRTLVKKVYSKYPWYTVNSYIADPSSASSRRTARGRLAAYTAGYEGKSIDSFFNDLLKRGIEMVIDVRANPISRKYGFSRRRLNEIADKLGIDYCHVPSLGIPSSYRANLDSYASYQRLLYEYEHQTLPARAVKVGEVAQLMCRRVSVLVCVEEDVRCCHRGRLAEAVSFESGLEVAHL